MPTGHRVQMASLSGDTPPPQLQEVLRCWSSICPEQGDCIWLTQSELRQSFFTSHHPAAGLAHGFPVLYTNTMTSPSAFLCLLETDAPLCGGTRTMLQKGKGPFSVLEVLREQLQPSSSHVRVAPYTHSHISPSRRAATTAARM